jgi:hypothetical protein
VSREDDSVRPNGNLPAKPFYQARVFTQHGGVDQTHVREMAVFLQVIIGGMSDFRKQRSVGIIIKPQHSNVHGGLLVNFMNSPD